MWLCGCVAKTQNTKMTKRLFCQQGHSQELNIRKDTRWHGQPGHSQELNIRKKHGNIWQKGSHGWRPNNIVDRLNRLCRRQPWFFQGFPGIFIGGSNTNVVIHPFAWSLLHSSQRHLILAHEEAECSERNEALSSWEEALSQHARGAWASRPTRFG